MFSQVWLKCLVGALASNFCVKCDNTPADDGDIFEFSELISGFSLLWGVTPYANSQALRGINGIY